MSAADLRKAVVEDDFEALGHLVDLVTLALNDMSEVAVLDL